MANGTELVYGGVERRKGDPGYDQSLDNYRNQGSSISQQPDYGADVPEENRGWWENPTRLSSFNNMIRAGEAKGDWKAPEGLDTTAIKEVWNYLNIVNEGKPVEEWAPLKEDDPVRDFLNNIPIPPVELMPETDRINYEKQLLAINETAYGKTQPMEEVDNWQKLEWDRQTVLSLTAAGYDPNLGDRPEWTRAPATLVQGVMAGIAPAFLFGAVSGGSLALPAGLIFGAIGAYQAYTGERVPVISDIYDKFQIPAMALESAIGQLSIDMTPEQRMKAFLEGSANTVGQVFGAAPTAEMAAGRLKYETMKPVVMNTMIWALDTAYNLGSDTAGLFGGGWEKMRIDQAATGYRWDIHKGVNDPVKIEGSIEDQAIREYYDRLRNVSDEKFMEELAAVEQDAYDRFGYSGVMNDLVGQTILDPLNFAPFLEGLGTKKVAKLFGEGRLAEVAGRMQGNPLIDALPFGVQNVVEAFTRGKGGKPDYKPFGLDIGPFGKREASKGLMGTLAQYKAEVQGGQFFGGVKPVKNTDLSRFARWVGGLDEQGNIKDLKVREQQANRYKEAFIGLGKKTPETQAIEYLTRVSDNIDIAGAQAGDIHEFNDMLHAIKAKGDPDSVQKVMDAVGEQVGLPTALDPEYSPVAKMIAEGLGYALDKIDQSMLIGQYDAVEPYRQLMLEVAKMSGEQPGVFLEKFSKDPDAYFKSAPPEVVEFLTQRGIIDGEQLKTKLDVFIGKGKDKIPWHPDELKANYRNKLLDEMGNYLKDKYKISPKGQAMQMIGVLKEVQSLLVLGINPGYFMNNAINNIVTRAAQGVFGFMTRAQVDQALDRMGMKDLTRLEVGVGAGGEGSEIGGLNAISRASIAKGKIEDIRKTVRAFSNKVGVFQILSQKVERAESLQAYTIGILSMWSKVWKEGVGFEKFSPEIERALDAAHPGLKEVYYEAVRSGMNMDEIKNSLSREIMHPEVRAVMDQAVRDIMQGFTEEQTQAVRDLMTESNIEGDLRDLLETAKTKEDVDSAINTVRRKLLDHISSKQLDILVGKANEIPGKIQSEGAIAALPLFTELQHKLTKAYLDHFKEWGDKMVAMRNANFEVRRKALKALEDDQLQSFKKLHAEEVAYYTGIVNGIGIESPEAQRFILHVAEMNKLSEDYFAYKNRVRDEVFSSGLRGKDWEKAYGALQADLIIRYKEYNKAVSAIRKQMDTQFGLMILKYTGDQLFADLVSAWRKQIFDQEMKRQQAMESIQVQLADNKIKGIERERVWNAFHETVYTPIVMELLRMEIEGANAIEAQWRAKQAGQPVEPAKPAEQAAPAEQAPVEQAPVEQAAPEAPVAEPVVTPEPVVFETGTPEALNEIFRIAQEYDIDALDPNGARRPLKKNGNIPDEERHLINAVNLYDKENLPNGEKYTRIEDIPVEAVQRAMEVRRAAKDLKERASNAKLAQERINRLHESNTEFARLAQEGALARAQLEEEWRVAFKNNPMQMAVERVAMDFVADKWLRENGFAVDEDGRNAYFAIFINEKGDWLGLGSIHDDYKNIFKPGWDDGIIAEDPITNILYSGKGLKNIDEIERLIRDWKPVEKAMALLIIGKLESKEVTTRYYNEFINRKLIPEKPSDELVNQARAMVKLAPVDKAKLAHGGLKTLAADIRFNSKGQAIIRGLNSPNFASMMHELVHSWARDLPDYQVERLLKYTGVDLTVGEYWRLHRLWEEGGDHTLWSKWEKAKWVEFEKVNEVWATANETYMLKGEAPAPYMRSLFHNFEMWLSKIYQAIKPFLGIDFTDADGNPVKTFDINAEINGISLKTILDDFWTDPELSRQYSFDEVIARKTAEPNTVDNIDQHRFLAKRAALEEVLGQFENMDDAIAKLAEAQTKENQTMVPEYFGEYSSYTVEDAINYMRKNPELDIYKNRNKTPMVESAEKVKVISPDNQKNYTAHYAVVELGEIVGDIKGWQGQEIIKNKEYPASFQNRDRSTLDSRMQMLNMADKLNPPGLLDPSSTMDGAPVIGSDYVINAGNGRVGALLYAVQNLPESYARYRGELDVAAARQGIDPSSYADMKNPVLVRVIDDQMSSAERAKLAFKSNDPVARKRNPIEVAKTDALLITSEMLSNINVENTETLQASLGKQKNFWFVQKFMEGIAANERGEFMDANGAITASGYSKIANAVVQKVYGEGLVQVINSGDKSPVSVAAKELLNTLPLSAKVESNISLGDTLPEYSLANDISIAVSRLEKMKLDGQTNADINTWVISRSMFGDDYTPVQKELVGVFNNLQKPVVIRNFLEKYMQLALDQPNPKQQTISLIPMEQVSKVDIFNAAKKYAGIIDNADVIASRAIGEVAEPASMPDSPLKKQPEKVATTPKDVADNVRIQAAENHIKQGKVVSLEDIELLRGADHSFGVDLSKRSLGQPAHDEIFNTGESARVFNSEYDSEQARLRASDANIERPAITHQIRPEVLSGLSKEMGQDIDAGQILTAYDSGKKAYVLANGTGTGKTWVGAGVLAELQPRKAVIVVPNEQIANGWMKALRESFGIEVTGKLSDVGKSGPVGAGLYWDTYTGIGLTAKGKMKLGNDWDFIIYDESHRLKNYGGKTVNAEAAVNLYAKSPESKVLFLSATPYQSLDEMRYLSPLGLWGNTSRDFDNFLGEHGYTQRPGFAEGTSVWVRGNDDAKELINVRNQMIQSGIFSQRELTMDSRLDNIFRRVPMGEYNEIYKQINQVFDEEIATTWNPKTKGIINSQRTLALRRVMELSKIQAAIPIAQQALSEGKQVAVFVQFKGELRAPQLKKREALTQRVTDVYSQLSETGLVQQLVDSLGGDTKVAKIYGGQPESKVKAAIDAYNKGMLKVAVVTTAKGGVGLSLHDTKGGAPRVQINITLPWSGQDFTQVAGRSYRYGTQSDVQQFWLFSDAMKEQEISSRVAGRLREMGAVVRGIHADTSAESMAAFDFGMLEDSYQLEKILNAQYETKGLSRGLQAEYHPEGIYLEGTQEVFDAIIYKDGEPISYLPSGTKIETGQDINGKEYKILGNGYDFENQDKLVVYLPDDNGGRVIYIDRNGPSLGQPAKRGRVTGFEDFMQNDLFGEPAKPATQTSDLPLFGGPLAEGPKVPDVVPQAQSTLLDFVPEPEKYGDQFNVRKSLTPVNKIRIMFPGFETVDIPVTEINRIAKVVKERGGNALGYDVISPKGKIVNAGKDISKLVDRAIKWGNQGESPSLGASSEPFGQTPVGKTPSSLYDGDLLNEAYYEKLSGALDHFGEVYKERMNSKMPGIDKLSPEVAAQVKKWVDGLNNDMTSAKLAAQRYGELQRDGALLNYSQRYGADNYVNMLFPYAFWYLRTMMNWGGRMIDRPAWYAMYARLKAMQKKTETKGLPSRFAGQLRYNAPWLPEWAGSNLFQDPLQQLFPLELYTNLGEGMEYEISSIDRETQQNLLAMVDSNEITREQYDAAMANKQDPLYLQAYDEAQKKSEMYNPVGLASLMMQPGMWVTDPYLIGQGKPERISILPITKTSRAVGTALKNTPLEFAGNIIEALGAGPETAIRKNNNLSPYGRWGDYYIDRELANLVADGEFSPTEAMIAMIDRKGDAYTAAEDRVKTMEMYKTPMATALQSIAKAIGGKGISGIAPALYHSVMPFGILPEGEMKQRGLAVEYSKAWDMMKAGDLKAINRFFEEHPEYQARLAINKDPDERMRNLLIDQIWERYTAIPSADKRLVTEGLGEKFQTNFLSNATKDYTTIDIPTLAYWAQALGGALPEKAGKVPGYQLPGLETYSPALSKAIQTYKDEKAKLFPMVDIQQQLYFNNNSDKKILKQFPQIQKYWDWKRQYEKEHPQLKPYFDKNREDAKAKPALETAPYDPNNYGLSQQEMSQFDPVLVKLITADAVAGQTLGEGAVASLRQIWEKLGRPEGSLQKWYENKVKPTFSN